MLNASLLSALSCTTHPLLTAGPAPAAPSAPSSFSAALRAAILTVGTGRSQRYGARKVFVTAAWAAMVDAGYTGSLSQFKLELVAQLPLDGAVILARFDLAECTDVAEIVPIDVVDDSTIRHLTSTWHCVIDDTAREPWESATSAEVR